MTGNSHKEKRNWDSDIRIAQEKWDRAVKNGFLDQHKDPGIVATRKEIFTEDEIVCWNSLLGKIPPRRNINEVRKDYPPNPVCMASFGKDQDPNVTPGWIDGDSLMKLNQMKKDLHALGDKLGAVGTDGTTNPVVTQGKEKGADILKKIKELQEKIDDLSDSLAPGKDQDIES